MNETRGDVHISTNVTKVLWWLSTILFVITEAIITVAIIRRHTFHSAQEFLDIYGMPLIASIPWIVGMRGYSIAVRSLAGSSNFQLTAGVLSRQFLYTQIAAYMMASFFFVEYCKGLCLAKIKTASFALLRTADSAGKRTQHIQRKSSMTTRAA